VLLNKRPVEIEVANDLNAALIAFHRVLRDRTTELMARLDALPYTADSFRWALQSDARRARGCRAVSSS
jgi:hypothetical protein